MKTELGHGSDHRRGTNIEAFMRLVSPEPTSGCWLWLGGDTGKGYGSFNLWTGERFRTTLAHRWFYEQFNGKVPIGLELDHKCRVRFCVNPSHLEAVTHLENVRRGRHAGREQTHCKYGHPFDQANTTYLRGGKSRVCKTCMRGWQRDFRQRQRTQ